MVPKTQLFIELNDFDQGQGTFLVFSLFDNNPSKGNLFDRRLR